jgi:structural maintenance of chromosome 3 (chondroitin sulfate proteoglycan 6)
LVRHKKDEFFLNRKRIQKNEVVSLLESAGFSKSNPYYIVQQGKVNTLCTMKDKDRLNLLKEVAGTTIYEERRSESIKIMEETASKQSKVEEVLSFIEERLNELDQEKQELVEYEKLDKQRRCLEFHLYQHEYNKANDELTSIEEERDVIRKNQQKMHSDLRNLQDEIFTLEDNSNNLKSTVERANKTKLHREQELTQIQEKKASLDSSIQDIEMTIKSRELSLQSYNKQLQDINQQLVLQQSKLDEIEPSYHEKNKVLIQEMTAVNSMKNRIDSLYGKQGRSSQFKTVKDRNNFLNQQVKKLKESLAKKEASVNNFAHNIEMDTKRHDEEKHLLNNLESSDILKNKNTFQDLSNSIHEKILVRNSSQEKRKNNWRELEKISEKLHENRNELEKNKNLLNSVLPHSITHGLAAIEYIVQEKKISGYYGPVIDNIVLKKDQYRQVVENAAGNQLFHVIVDNDKTAAILINELEAKNAGRLTFLPLSRLRVKEYNYPKNTNDVYPLIEVALEYEKEVEKAIKLIFGQKLIARDIHVASDYAKQYNMDVLTTDGDIASSKGSFEGGFHDEKLSKIGAVEKIRRSNAEITKYSDEETKLKNVSESLENEITDLIRTIQKLENEKASLKLLEERTTKEIMSKRKLLHNLIQTIQENQKNHDLVFNEIQSLQENINNYENEKNLPLLSNLSEEERNELMTLEENFKVLTKKIDKLKSEITILSETKDEIETNIESNLLKRKDELELLLANVNNVGNADQDGGAELQQTTTTSKKGRKSISQQPAQEQQQSSFSSSSGATLGHDLQSELSNLQSELISVEKELVSSQQSYDEVTTSILQKSNQILKLETEIDNLKEKEKILNDAILNITKQFDRLVNRRTITHEIIQMRTKLIRDLGSLPEDKLQEFSRLNEKEIVKRLKTINDKLKQYSNVNRKALDQFLSFNDQRETLLKRKDEMKRDTQAIQSLIQSLDLQKDEAINRTFISVSKHFADVFQELVPNGYGKLVMKTALDEHEEGEDIEEEQPKQKKAGGKKKSGATTSSSTDHVLNEESSENLLPVESYRGVQVTVAFNKNTGENYSMQQLSGGQKALVALALIFAIQRCDPAPFYLFDEIDQALDANYRRAVANLIQRQANSEESPAQFITTTFRPEFVEVADKCFGIALTNKVSNLYSLDKVRNISNRFAYNYF